MGVFGTVGWYCVRYVGYWIDRHIGYGVGLLIRTSLVVCSNIYHHMGPPLPYFHCI